MKGEWWTETKHPEKKRHWCYFSSVSLTSCCQPNREGSVPNAATPNVDPYSACCIQDKRRYSSSLRPSLLWNTFSFVFYGEWRERARSPCCRASQVGRAPGRARERVCARMLAMVSFPMAAMQSIICALRRFNEKQASVAGQSSQLLNYIPS